MQQPLSAACRERNDGLYTALTYLSAKIVEEVVVALLVSLAVSNIVFWQLALAGSWALFWYTYFQTTLIGIGARLFRLSWQMPLLLPSP
jgi:hypothetical protein